MVMEVVWHQSGNKLFAGLICYSGAKPLILATTFAGTIRNLINFQLLKTPNTD